MDVAHAVAVDEIAAFGDLDVGAVGIGVAGQAEIKPAAVALLVEPELARLAVVEVLRLVFQVVARVPGIMVAADRRRPTARRR